MTRVALSLSIMEFRGRIASRVGRELHGRAFAKSVAVASVPVPHAEASLVHHSPAPDKAPATSVTTGPDPARSAGLRSGIGPSARKVPPWPAG